MPLYNSVIEEIDEAILRPVIINVTEDILERMDLPKNIPVMFKGETTTHLYRGSEIDPQGDRLTDHNRYGNETLLYLETTIVDNENTLLSTPVDRTEERFIYWDKAVHAQMFPSMVSKKVDITMTFTGTEKEVERWRATLRRKTSQGAIDMLHMVTYSYPIPLAYMYLLCEIYNMRQAVAPYDPNQTLSGYFKDTFIKPFTVITNTAGNGGLYSICEKQLPIYGWFDFGTNPPKPERDNDLARYSLSFTYSFYFDCPETVSMHCPLIVHNQMLPYKFLNTKRPFEVDYIIAEGSRSQEAFNHYRFEAERQRRKVLGRPGLPIPWFDDWLGEKHPSFYQSLLKLLIQVDPNNPHLMIDLLKLGEWELDPLLVRYLKFVRNKLNKPYEALLNLTHWEFEDLTLMSDIHVSEELVVSSKRQLSERELHHLILSICVDPTALTDDAIDDLKKNPCFFKHYLAIIMPWLKDHFKWDLEACALNPDGDDDMTDEEWKEIIDAIEDNGGGLVHGNDFVPWHLVGQYAIWAHRNED